ncbi:hypothetical protein B0T17DRAFT_503127 [Bombardia bombarda]|uniref:Uncharacterized protein n=1 Tax=Bombardia bombarda TaxID=252184 RepID=A0AA40CFN3_9PEZI|nr:hypothetical protein B0T17DRAFT_503127 [Bombardia bombarda]
MWQETTWFEPMNPRKRERRFDSIGRLCLTEAMNTRPTCGQEDGKQQRQTRKPANPQTPFHHHLHLLLSSTYCPEYNAMASQAGGRVQIRQFTSQFPSSRTRYGVAKKTWAYKVRPEILVLLLLGAGVVGAGVICRLMEPSPMQFRGLDAKRPRSIRRMCPGAPSMKLDLDAEAGGPRPGWKIGPEPALVSTRPRKLTPVTQLKPEQHKPLPPDTMILQFTELGQMAFSDQTKLRVPRDLGLPYRVHTSAPSSTLPQNKLFTTLCLPSTYLSHFKTEARALPRALLARLRIFNLRYRKRSWIWTRDLEHENVFPGHHVPRSLSKCLRAAVVGGMVKWWRADGGVMRGSWIGL